MCNYYNKNYILAALYFKKYYDINNNKKYPKIKGALYNYIYCLYLSSFDYNLNQLNTYNAIYGIKKYLKIYPNSNKILFINKLLNFLIKKIEKKEFEIAIINYNLENYKSAFLNFKNFINEYPNSNFLEKAFFYALKTQFKIAIYNVNKKKFLKKIIIFCNEFMKKYPIYQYNIEKIKYKIKNIIKNTY